MNCARSVIELIMRYWPYSIDALQPEEAVVNGVRPIFFSQENVCLLSRLNYLGAKFRKQGCLDRAFLVNGQGKPIEFGADQCAVFPLACVFCNSLFHSGILVRNDAVKENLKRRLGNNLILSVLTSPRQPFT